MISSSTPGLIQFDPKIIPYQFQVIKDTRRVFDYSLGTHEILLSGSVGSAKSILMAHIVVTHCLMNMGAIAMIGRLSMPALRSTLFAKILEHISVDLKEGQDYWVNDTTATIKFRNGSKIISRSWSDKKYFKVRSLELSLAAIEEASENETQSFYNEVKMRVGRLPHVKENIIINATNPDEPDHWLYKYFITSKKKTRHVYYSVTTDNPFLPPQYIAQLKADLDPLMARRMIYGEWLSIQGEVVYYAYDKSRNFRDYSYEINPKLPIHLCFDFNIASGKPLSCALMQYTWPIKHVFDESVIHTARTMEVLDDLEGRGLIKKDFKYVVNGDAAGRHRDTRNFKSDYDIIVQWFAKRSISMELRVPSANPPVRSRHNRLNAEFINANGETNLYVYKEAKTVDEAFRLTKLKKGAGYIEDDSKHYQHVGTGCGYSVCYETLLKSHIPNKMQLL